MKGSASPPSLLAGCASIPSLGTSSSLTVFARAKIFVDNSGIDFVHLLPKYLYIGIDLRFFVLLSFPGQQTRWICPLQWPGPPVTMCQLKFTISNLESETVKSCFQNKSQTWIHSFRCIVGSDQVGTGHCWEIAAEKKRNSDSPTGKHRDCRC